MLGCFCVQLQSRMDRYFIQLVALVEERKTSSRIRFLLLDTIDLRKVLCFIWLSCGWLVTETSQLWNCGFSLPSAGQHLSNYGCLEIRGKINLHVLCCVVYHSCTQWYAYNSTYRQSSHTSWKVLESPGFLFQKFPWLESPGKWIWYWKVLEIKLWDPGKSFTCGWN